MKKWSFILLLPFLAACSDSFQLDSSLKNPVGTQQSPMPKKPDGGGGGSDSKSPDPDVLKAPASEESFVQQISNANPGMIHDCTGQPVANRFLIETVKQLQERDRLAGKKTRWGFFLKPDGRIPRDILAYAWSSEREGTNKTFVIDFVGAGCNNTPWNADFSDPAVDARPIWLVTNSDGYANNGVWVENHQ